MTAQKSGPAIATKDLTNCDVVMKGGITSGVVYPPAVIELSKKFRFKNVGGTSAGAIAAAFTAAAEYGRGIPGAGFDRLGAVPEWLANNIKTLFQPQRETRSLFRVFFAAVGRVGGPPVVGPDRRPAPPPRFKWLRTAIKMGFALVVSFPMASLLGSLPGLGLLALAMRSSDPVYLRVASIGAAIILLIIGVLLAAIIRVVFVAQSAIPRNYYGLCRGIATSGNGQLPELTQWLSDTINELAGLDPRGDPLTFGQLRKNEPDLAEHRIDLAMITTNLTHGRPYRLPFDENIFYFDRKELETLFPSRVVTWMVNHPGPADQEVEHHGLHPMPEARDLPVVVATRMSLSFPGLVSAVPLYAVDYDRPDCKERGPERCWFSDGGITSNFPVHFFDSVIPRWPTFAINLRQRDPIFPQAPMVWMPESNRQGILRAWGRFDQKPDVQYRGAAGPPPAGLSGFGNAILLTMQNWMDNLQLQLPGYRDRIVHISLHAGEGGLNLDMPREMVIELSKRGASAGLKLIEHFTTPSHPMGWDNHRWIRFRSTLALMEATLEAMARGYDSVQPGRSYEGLIQREIGEPPTSYQWDPDLRKDGIEAMETLVALGRSWSKAPGRFGRKAPRPSPVLRIMPKV